MNRVFASAVVLGLGLLSACQFNQSVNKDLVTGAYARGDGLGVDNMILNINGEKSRRTEFEFGEMVQLEFNDVTGLKREDGQAYPGLALYITDHNKDTIVSNNNLLVNMTEGTDLSPLKLDATFAAAFPFGENNAYKVHVDIWDTKGDGTFHYDMPFTIVPNTLLSLSSEGIAHSNVYLWNDTKKQAVHDPTISGDDVYVLIIEGVDGLQEKEGSVYPSFSLHIIDQEGNAVLAKPNLLSDYADEGVDPAELKQQLIAHIQFGDGQASNPCQLTAVVKDNASSKSLTLETALTIE